MKLSLTRGADECTFAHGVCHVMMKMNRRSHGRPTHTTSWTNSRSSPRCAREIGLPFIVEDTAKVKEMTVKVVVLLLSPFLMTKYPCFRRYRCPNRNLPPAQGGRRYARAVLKTRKHDDGGASQKTASSATSSRLRLDDGDENLHLSMNSRGFSCRRCVVAPRSRIPGCPENAASTPILSSYGPTVVGNESLANVRPRVEIPLRKWPWQ